MKKLALLLPLFLGFATPASAGLCTDALPGTTCIDLLSAASATGSWIAWGPATSTWQCKATSWGGATAQLQSSPDGGTTAINADGASITANGGFRSMDLEAGLYRVLITGSPTGVSCLLGRGRP